MFTPITFSSETEKSHLDLQTAVAPITSVEQTQTGIWDIAGASFDLAFNEERLGSFWRNARDSGVTGEMSRQTLSIVYNLTGNEKYKPQGRNNYYTPSSYENLYKDLMTDEASLEALSEFLKANPDSGLLNPAEIKAKLDADHKTRRDNLSSALMRNDSDFDKFVGNLLGAGGGVILDPALIPGIFTPLGKGRLAIQASKVFGITFAEEAFIQQDVKEFKDFLGEDYDAWFNVFTASGFAAAIPILGRGLSKALKAGRVKLTPEIKKLQKSIIEQENTKIKDDYEIDRADKLLRETGGVSGVKLNIHTKDETVLTGLRRTFTEGLEKGNAKQIASTLRAKIGVGETNRVLSQAQLLGRGFDSITSDEIGMLLGQQRAGIKVDLKKATASVKRVNELKVDIANSKPIPPSKKMTESDEYQTDYDLEDEVWQVESRESVASPSTPIKTNRQILNEIDDEINQWENFKTCRKGG